MRRSLVQGLLTDVIARAALGGAVTSFGCVSFFRVLRWICGPSLLGDDVDQAVGRSGRESRRVLFCTRAPGNEEQNNTT
ncbi:uncharacterized protein BO88DRAFT_66484 [Aspergillus vadensis CBS 113365]|uniref:Uncharacterized protein n=1 Tax=Aspergillus vadensis (strain CBS 113365 / IMI 142717 / IBT 24658) TaxID=1448311 RepID=A0A319BC14_ASPVC|nr:hypothetical protein BO88DRAFT_66484 [Aspergillus vadensis CBS 113365]PYH68190.1 hypothetical protein BO88DRAFT_66484 [Aspergillus vadensis CBS 113365]